MTLKLTTTYHLEGKFYVAYCAELGVTSQGETLEGRKNLREAIELYRNFGRGDGKVPRTP